MKRHRVFVAINLPENIKKKLAEYQAKWPELPVRWTKPNNIHITLVFLGYLSDEEVLEVCKTVKEVVSKHNSFDINLTKICYGPQNKKPPRPPKFSEEIITEQDKTSSRKFGWPRMIWTVGEESKELSSLKKDLTEDQRFVPHITLGRIRQWEWRRIEPEDRPEIDQDIDLNFTVNSIEIMESILKRGGPEYRELSSFDLR